MRNKVSNPSLMSYDEMVRTVTDNYLANIGPDNPPDLDTVQAELIIQTRGLINYHNTQCAKGQVYQLPKELSAWQIAAVLLKTEYIVNVDMVGDRSAAEFCLLAKYQREGDDKGTYSYDEVVFKRPIRRLKPSITQAELKNVLDILSSEAPVVNVNTNKDLIPVKNGVFDFETKTRLPFSPDFVFLSKIKVDYNPFAQNVILHNDDDGTDWDVESWFQSLSDTPEVVELLWEVVSANVRPNVRWNKSLWFKASSGNNGKGTFCELLRNLSPGKAASISLRQFTESFGLTDLIGASACIVDEVRVNDFIDDVESFKSAVTGDVISINRKYKNAVRYRFNGIIVFCVNSAPKVHDKTGSLYRRLLVVPFDHCFTGMERQYIKDEYMSNIDVLEYVLYRALNMNFYKFSEPEACKKELSLYQEYNDTVLQFMNEVLPELVWDLAPFPYLYQMFQSWFKKNNPSGCIQGKNTFVTELLENLHKFPEWYCPGRDVPIRPGFRMYKHEPLVNEYGLCSDWSGLYDVPAMKPSRKLKTVYRGILRIGFGVDVDPSEEPNDDSDEKGA